MACVKPKQGPGKGKDTSALAKLIKDSLKKNGMTQKELAIRSGLPESRISRILRDGNVKLTERDINLLAIGLRKSREWRDKLRYLAWPELEYIDKALYYGESVIDLNCRLEKAGIPLIGNDC